jgi:hypothetical protein
MVGGERNRSKAGRISHAHGQCWICVSDAARCAATSEAKGPYERLELFAQGASQNVERNDVCLIERPLDLETSPAFPKVGAFRSRCVMSACEGRTDVGHWSDTCVMGQERISHPVLGASI